LIFLALKRFNKKDFAAWSLIAGLVGSTIIHFSFLAPYLMGSKVVENAPGNAKDRSISILIANVLMKNRQAEQFIDVADKADPDLLLVMEVNNWWIKELAPMRNKYPHILEQPYNNAYGMALYSKFDLKDVSIEYLNHSKVPSIHGTIQMPSGESIKFHGMHPVAPFPSDKYPTNIGDPTGQSEREVELLKVGRMVNNHNMPAIVAGDFNDVAWSHTSRLFGVEGELNDVRIGRGLYNTFDAKSFFMRWPLDHFYVTEHFQVVEFRKLDNAGSDHFPLYGEFILK
jgi:endonuclease/exonuclease/phosphatase (EEP) superfamily protein YafD